MVGIGLGAIGSLSESAPLSESALIRHQPARQRDQWNLELFYA
jgi:hypothetical protein